MFWRILAFFMLWHSRLQKKNIVFFSCVQLRINLHVLRSHASHNKSILSALIEMEFEITRLQKGNKDLNQTVSKLRAENAQLLSECQSLSQRSSESAAASATLPSHCDSLSSADVNSFFTKISWNFIAPWKTWMRHISHCGRQRGIVDDNWSVSLWKYSEGVGTTHTNLTLSLTQQMLVFCQLSNKLWALASNYWCV